MIDLKHLRHYLSGILIGIEMTLLLRKVVSHDADSAN